MRNKKTLVESGQAMVEFIVVVMFCLIFMIGSYEVGILFHNYTVMSGAMRDAAWATSLGAPDDVVMQLVLDETKNLFVTGFLNYDVSEDIGLAIEVWNDNYDIAPSPSIWSNHASYNGYWPEPWMGNKGDVSGFADKTLRRSEYIFRAEGYNIRVGMVLVIGFYIPVLQQVSVYRQTVTASQRIQVKNDLDEDGMVDIYEPEWFWGQKAEGALWRPYSHRDGAPPNGIYLPNGYYLDDEDDTDNDGDGTQNNLESSPSYNYRYDYDNDGITDKFDTGNRIRNPLIGPYGSGA